MSFVAAAIIGGTAVASAGLGYLSSENAADASQNNTNATVGEQAREFNQTQANQQPFLQGGTNAFNSYLGQLGVTGGGNNFGQTPGAVPTPSFNYTGTQPQPTANPGFSFDASTLSSDPAYQFAYQQAMQGVDRQLNAGGYANSGNKLTALQDRAAGLASQQYQNAYTNQLNAYNVNAANTQQNYTNQASAEDQAYQRALTGNQLQIQQAQTQYGQQQDYLNRLAAAGGVGQTAANNLGTAGAQTAANIGNAYLQNGVNQGNAAALQYGSLNNAVQGGASNYLTYLTQQNALAGSTTSMPVQPLDYGNLYNLNANIPTY